MAINVRLSGLFVGEDWRITFNPDDGDPVNVSDWELEFRLGTSPGASDVALVTEEEGDDGEIITLTSASDGEGYVSIPSLLTAEIEPSRVATFDDPGVQYYYELWRTKADEAKVIAYGVADIKA